MVWQLSSLHFAILRLRHELCAVLVSAKQLVEVIGEGEACWAGEGSMRLMMQHGLGYALGVGGLIGGKVCIMMHQGATGRERP